MKYLYVLLLALLLPVTAHATEVTMGGKLEIYGASYTERRNGNENQYGEIRLLPKVTVTVSDKLFFFVEGDFRADSEGISVGVIDGVERTHRWMANIREGYVDYSFGEFRVRAGKQIFNWAVTDTVSPSDNLSPRDWTDIIRWERIGIPTVTLKYGHDTFVEGVFVPFFTPSKLPAYGSRWERELPVGLVNGEQDVLNAGHSQFALRIGTTVFGFDLGMSFYKGYSYSPSFRLNSLPLSKSLSRRMTWEGLGGLELTPVYHAEEVYALSAAKGIAGLNFRTEIGYFQQQHDDDFIQYVVGVDQEWSNVLRETDSLYVLLQYSNEKVTQHDSPVPFKTIDFRRIFSNAVMARIKYSPDDSGRWAVNLDGSNNFSGHDWYMQPSLTWKKDNVELKGGLDIMGGPEDSFFGGYKKNNRVFILATLYF